MAVDEFTAHENPHFSALRARARAGRRHRIENHRSDCALVRSTFGERKEIDNLGSLVRYTHYNDLHIG